jgi:hypothetical protein
MRGKPNMAEESITPLLHQWVHVHSLYKEAKTNKIPSLLK